MIFTIATVTNAKIWIRANRIYTVWVTNRDTILAVPRVFRIASITCTDIWCCAFAICASWATIREAFVSTAWIPYEAAIAGTYIRRFALCIYTLRFAVWYAVLIVARVFYISSIACTGIWGCTKTVNTSWVANRGAHRMYIHISLAASFHITIQGVGLK